MEGGDEMSGDRDQRVKELLAQLLDTPADGRPKVLELACGGDAELRAEVESLAQAYEDGSDFLATSEQSIAEPPATAASEAAGARIGRYKLLQQIGEGGFGTVFLADQEHPVRRRVALKIIKPGMDTKQVIARFQAERQALAMMDHPHIARVFDAGSTDLGRSYFVMELVEGVPITRFCDQHKLIIRERLGLFIQVSQAVQHAHTKGIIHRDLKPSNILVTVADGAAIPKVIDFGIAKATQGRLTEQSFTTDQQHWLGTPQYMSPEQADGSPDIDTRTDIYSLGVILYELLCGCAPFDFRSSGYSEIQRVIREVDPPPPSAKTAKRELRGDLDRIVLKAMEKDRARRYETASAFAADIQSYLNNEPVTARHAGRIYRLRKLVRRNRIAFAASAAVALTLVIGSVVSTALYIKARNAKTAESVLREDAEAKAYASDMLAVQQAIALDSLGRAREILDRYRPKPGEADRRGWEWRYLWRQSRSDALTMICRRPMEIASLAASNNGRWLAVGESRGGGLSIWDLQTRRQVVSLPGGDGQVHVGFSPRELLLAYTSVSHDAQNQEHSQLHLWDGVTRQERWVAPLTSWCIGLAFSQDGQIVATSTGDNVGRVTLRRIADAALIDDLAAPQIAATNASPFAAATDLSKLAITTLTGFRLVELQTRKEWTEDIGVGTVRSAAVSPDGRIVAFGGGGYSPSIIRLRDGATGSPLGSPLEGHRGRVNALLFWPDGKTLASASADQSIRLWDVSDPAHAHPIGHPLRAQVEIRRLALLPDNKILVSGATDGSVCLWDTTRARDSGEQPASQIVSWGFDATDGSILTADRSGRIVRHDGAVPSKATTIMELGKPLIAAGFHFADGNLLGARFGRTTYDLWNLQTKKWVAACPVPQRDWRYATVTPQVHLVVNFIEDDIVHEWDSRTGTQLPSWRTPGGMVTIAFTPNCRRRLTVSSGGLGLLKEMDSGRETTLSLDIGGVDDARFSHDGSLVAISSGVGYVGLWRTADLVAGGKKIVPIARLGGFARAPHSLAFSPDGRRLAASGSDSESIKLFDLDRRQEVLSLASSGQSLEAAQFSPDGTMLGALDFATGELHVWRAPTEAEIEAAEANEAKQEAR